MASESSSFSEESESIEEAPQWTADTYKSKNLRAAAIVGERTGLSYSLVYTRSKQDRFELVCMSHEEGCEV